MKVLAVLSHHMSSKGVLGDESIARANLAIQTFKENNYNFLITSGWAYSSGCSIPISDVVAEYVSNISDIDTSKIISDSNSRDTVGDAYFIRRHLEAKKFSEITVITSDYHIKRTEIIFNQILCNASKIEVIGVNTPHKMDANILRHEEASIGAFERTFNGICFDNINLIYQAMVTKHPFYNGNIYPKIEIDGSLDSSA